MNLPHFGKKEYWFVAFLHNGVPVVWRLENVHSEPEAVRKGAEKLSGRLFKVFSSNNKDEVEANKHARALLLEQGEDVDAILHRAKHTDIAMEDNTEDNGHL